MTHIYLLTLPESFASGVLGPLDLLATDDILLRRVTGEPECAGNRFHIELVGPTRKVTMTFGRALEVDRTLAEATSADVIYIPPLAVLPDELHEFDPAVLEWLRERHAEGVQICSACTGTLLMAAAGILDGECATTHWAYKQLFDRHYPQVELKIERTLVVSGAQRRLITAGAHASWHDLMLFLMHRHVGAAAARQTAKVFLLDWHDLDQTAYATFRAPMQHGDAEVHEAQDWLAENASHPRPVETVIECSSLPKRSFLRRFRQATGYTPIQYTQQLRVENAKSLLESTDEPVEEIAWHVGYEDAAYFRRLFKRVTGINPAKYRKSFRTPPDVTELLQKAEA